MMNTQFNESVTRVLAEMNLDSLEQANQYCKAHNVDPKAMVMEKVRLKSHSTSTNHVTTH